MVNLLSYSEFEKALLKNVEFALSDGNFVFNFYSARRSSIVGLVNVCIVVCVPYDLGGDVEFFRTESICPAVAAYQLYLSLSKRCFWDLFL